RQPLAGDPARTPQPLVQALWSVGAVTPLPQEIVMLKRKPLLLVLACLALILLTWVAFLASWPFGPRHHIDKQGVEALREGMNEPEVVQVFGVPAGNYSTWRRRYRYERATTKFLTPQPPEWK